VALCDILFQYSMIQLRPVLDKNNRCAGPLHQNAYVNRRGALNDLLNAETLSHIKIVYEKLPCRRSYEGEDAIFIFDACTSCEVSCLLSVAREQCHTVSAVC
jgi:hypothetical protein